MRYIQAIGRRLRELLQERKYTQSKFSLKCGISRITINRIINNRVEIVTFETLIMICNALQITLMDFFNSEVFVAEFEAPRKKQGKKIRFKK